MDRLPGNGGKMPNFKVAHIREQGIDLIIVPLECIFGSQARSQQDAEIHQLQMGSNAAGLAGTVVPVWDAGGGRMGFIAPTRWHPFFASLSLGQVFQNINKEISW